MTLKSKALEFYSAFPEGIISTSVHKNVISNLEIAYSPGIANICTAISNKKSDIDTYTSSKNTILIISDGSAVLGLGNLGPEAVKPVLEAKASLLKLLGGVDSMHLCIKTDELKNIVKDIVFIVKTISTGFQGILIEDIAAPNCFKIEELLQKSLDIPVFHDDQHGTAIVACGAILNWLNITKRDIKTVKVVAVGAGAAGIASLRLVRDFGVHNIILFDSKGVITNDRFENKYKKMFASNFSGSIKDALDGADIFLGASVANVVEANAVKNMNHNPLILALSNPVPDINIEEVSTIRPDAFICTGSSTSKNQANNLLCFPFFFRFMIDYKINCITKKLKIAAAKAVAQCGLMVQRHNKQLLPSAKDSWLKYFMPLLIAKNMFKQNEDFMANRILPYFLGSHSDYTHYCKFIDEGLGVIYNKMFAQMYLKQNKNKIIYNLNKDRPYKILIFLYDNDFISVFDRFLPDFLLKVCKIHCKSVADINTRMIMIGAYDNDSLYLDYNSDNIEALLRLNMLYAAED